jgi:hypothetical protein
VTSRCFELHRDTDISDSGAVAEGEELWRGGPVALTWLTGGSPAVFDRIETVEARTPLTRIVWV